MIAVSSADGDGMDKTSYETWTVYLVEVNKRGFAESDESAQSTNQLMWINSLAESPPNIINR